MNAIPVETERPIIIRANPVIGTLVKHKPNPSYDNDSWRGCLSRYRSC